MSGRRRSPGNALSGLIKHGRGCADESHTRFFVGTSPRSRFRQQRMIAIEIPGVRLGLWLGLAGLSILGGAAGVHAQGGVAAGKAKAQACVVCHGPLGLSQVPNAPHLAGQPEIYLAEQLRAYRSGKRNHEVMSVIAKPLSDEDIDQLSAWYASLAIEIKR
jgi:cytochrome c553